ncbi:MAG TPA: DUF4193 family protein [Acidimicrobiia bacterium]|jgi:hypothetical protein|nr:DUF4193 family protein [Acidimicrobiia bacterium]
MSDDEFDEPEIDEEDVEDDDIIDDDDLADEDIDDDDDVIGEEADDAAAIPDDPAAIVEVPVATPVVEEGDEEDDEVVDLDEELHPDDVEEALDVVLRERTAAAGLEDEEDEEVEPDDRGEGGTKIVPRRPGEFLCSSCFLVLPRNQLADEKRLLCRDCV